MNLKTILFSILLLPTIAFSQALFTAPLELVCGETKVILEGISTEHGEKPEFVGQDDEGNLYSVWTNNIEKSFTMLVTSKRGKITCILGVGSIPTKS